MIIILPTNDIMDHDEDSTVCECNPRIEIVDGDIMLIHNSFDGREFEEQIEEILNDK